MMNACEIFILQLNLRAIKEIFSTTKCAFLNLRRSSLLLAVILIILNAIMEKMWLIS